MGPEWIERVEWIGEVGDGRRLCSEEIVAFRLRPDVTLLGTEIEILLDWTELLRR